MWASTMLGTLYKLPVPFEARRELESSLGPAIVEEALRRSDREALAVLRALAAVDTTPFDLPAARAAGGLAAKGISEPPWAAVVGRPAFVGACRSADVFGDQEAYYMTFRYEGRPAHVVTALYDRNLGGIVKDAFAGTPRVDPCERAAQEDGVVVVDADPELMAATILQGVETGDRFLDNDWSEDFKHTRALLSARMQLLPRAAFPEPAAVSRAERDDLIEQYLASPFAPPLEAARTIVEHCLDARCDYGDGDPLRWSPIVVELFMLDFLPRKVTLGGAEIRAVPEVLNGWVRFALTTRGLEERWIEETQRAVDRFAARFRQYATDPSRFGPAKAIANAMRADGVDLTDEQQVQDWMDDFNARPHEDRDDLIGRFPFP